MGGKSILAHHLRVGRGEKLGFIALEKDSGRSSDSTREKNEGPLERAGKNLNPAGDGGNVKKNLDTHIREEQEEGGDRKGSRPLIT